MIHIRTARSNDLDQLVKLADECLGRGYLSVNKLFPTKPHFTLVAELDEQIVGFTIHYVLKIKDLHSFTHLKPGTDPVLRTAQNIGFRKATCVDPSYRGRSIGSQLISEGMKRLAPQVDAICAIGWKRGNDIPAERMLIKLGYRRGESISKYWYEESIKRPFTCPECGEPPCTCDAQLFVYS